jgi:hypothetical protein
MTLGATVQRQFAQVGILATAVHQCPQRVLDPACADSGVECAVGLAALDQLVHEVVVGPRSAGTQRGGECARIPEQEQQMITGGDTDRTRQWSTGTHLPNFGAGDDSTETARA